MMLGFIVPALMPILGAHILWFYFHIAYIDVNGGISTPLSYGGVNGKFETPKHSLPNGLGCTLKSLMSFLIYTF